MVENDGSVLREMQEKGPDEGPAKDKAEERETRAQGNLPVVLRKRLQDRRLKADVFSMFFVFVNNLKLEV